MGVFLKAFQSGVKPSSNLPIDKWVESEVILPHSIKTGGAVEYDITPYLVEPLRAIADHDTREIVLMSPTGSGKTSGIIEAATCWVIAENPANMAVVFQTEAAVNKWRASRMMPSLKRTAATRDLIPPERSPKNKKDSIQFPSMLFQTINATITKLQGDTIKILVGDEVWAWDSGLVEELRRRNHGQFDYKMFLTSQGGEEDDQLDENFQAGEIFDWSFKCPTCKQYHRFLWQQVKGWHEQGDDGKRVYYKTDNNEWDWDKIKKHCRYECNTPDCDQVWGDTPIERRSMHNDAKYISRENNHLPNRKSFHLNAIAVWWYPLFELVQGWLTAQDKLKEGNKEPLKQFIQKRLAESWVEKIETATIKLKGEPYLMKDFANGEKWEHETHRLMTVDVQGDHFWVLIRAWSAGKGSRLLYESRAETWEGLRIIQKQYRVLNQHVFVDRGYRPEEVAEQCFKSMTLSDNDKWQPLLGDKADGYPYKNRKTGRIEVWPHSKFHTETTTSGLRYKYIKHSNLKFKDRLTFLLSGDDFGIGLDHSKEYKAQMESEHKVKKPSGKWIYDLIKEHYQNHLWDCEVMQVVGAKLCGLVKMEAEKVD